MNLTAQQIQDIANAIIPDSDNNIEVFEGMIVVDANALMRKRFVSRKSVMRLAKVLKDAAKTDVLFSSI